MARYNNNNDLDQQIRSSAWDGYFSKLTEKLRENTSSGQNPWATAPAYGLGVGHRASNASSDAQRRRDIIKQANLQPEQLQNFQNYAKRRKENDSWFDSTSEGFLDDISKSASAVQGEIESRNRRENPDQNFQMGSDDFQRIVDRIDDETSYFDSSEKSKTIKRILAEQGFNEQNKSRFDEYVGEKLEDDGWFDGNTEGFYQDILKQSFRVAKDKSSELSPRQKELGYEKKAQQDKENYEKEYSKVQKDYEKYDQQLEDFQNQQHQSLDTAQQQMIKDYGVSNNLVDQGIGQAQEFSSAPSVVNQSIQANLADNTRNDILSRQANRSRYGSGLSDPNQRQMDDRLGFAKSIAAARAQEQQGRVAHLQGALSQGASQKANIAGNKHAGTVSGINSRNSLQGLLFNSLGAKSQLALGKMQGLYGANNQADNEAIRKMQYLGGQEFRKTEPLRRAQRRIDATNQQKLGAAGLVGGAALAAGGTVTGNPALISAGASTAKFGLGAFSSGYQNTATSSKKTQGYYGQKNHGYIPQNTYGSAPILNPGFSQEDASNVGKAGLSLLPESWKPKETKEKSVTDKATVSK